MEKVTIMMVTYNRLDLTKETLEYLFENTKYPFNLVVVDNGSSDGTVEYLDETLYEKTKAKTMPAFNECHVVFNAKNLGIGIGRNLALYEAVDIYDPKWLATIDNDVWLPEGWLGECVEILQNNPQFASIGVNMEGKQYREVNKGGKVFQEKPKGNLGTAAMVFPRSLQKMLGYFNYKDFGLYGEEDSDWGMRTRALGLKLGYIKEMGKHLGEDERDQGEYREFKNNARKGNLDKFYKNARDYMSRRKPLFIPFTPEDVQYKP